MSEQKSHNTPPFKTLGSHLKYLREQLQQSPAEVSGAVEIDESMLLRIEEGLERPSEDILLLLISHYDMQDQEAVQLWELAGYDGDGAPTSTRFRPEDMVGPNKQLIMLLAMDMRTMYSDGLDVNINQAGITLNFTQASGKGQRMPFGRIGMSYDQAQNVLRTLQDALLKARYLKHPRGLPAPKKEQPEDQVN